MPSFVGSPVAKARSRVGVAARLGDPEKLLSARRDLAAAKLAEYIARTVAEAPPLDDDQRSRLVLLLTPSASRAGDPHAAA